MNIVSNKKFLNDSDFSKIKRVGYLLFLDIAGFTALSEKLNHAGKDDTEELTSILNSFFDQMLQTIKKYNGQVLWFAGDGILVRFNEESSPFHCAKIMLKKTKKFKHFKTRLGKFALDQKIIIGHGTWTEYTFNFRNTSLIFLTRALLKQISKLEKQARPGEIKRFEIKSKVLSNIFPVVTNKIKAPRNRANFRTHRGEHRPVSCLFLELSGYSESKPNSDVLRETLEKIVSIVEDFKGSILLIDSIQSKGCRILITFGTPKLYHDDAKRSVKAADKIIRLELLSSKLIIKFGIDYGFVYSGPIGNDWIRQYTVIGNVVNTGARLVSTAEPGQVLVSEFLKQKIKSDFEYQELKPVKVKGITKKLERFQIIREKKFHTYNYNFVGRIRELRFLRDQVKRGRFLTIVEGKAGIKTACLYALFQVLKEYPAFPIKALKTMVQRSKIGKKVNIDKLI